jgi:hypothetical protein
VKSYHKFARGYLDSRGKMPRWNGILGPDGQIYGSRLSWRDSGTHCQEALAA